MQPLKHATQVPEAMDMLDASSSALEALTARWGAAGLAPRLPTSNSAVGWRVLLVQPQLLRAASSTLGVKQPSGRYVCFLMPATTRCWYGISTMDADGRARQLVTKAPHLEEHDGGAEAVQRIDGRALLVRLLVLRVGPDEQVQVARLKLVGLLGQQLAVCNPVVRGACAEHVPVQAWASAGSRLAGACDQPDRSGRTRATACAPSPGGLLDACLSSLSSTGSERSTGHADACTHGHGTRLSMRHVMVLVPHVRTVFGPPLASSSHA